MRGNPKNITNLDLFTASLLKISYKVMFNIKFKMKVVSYGN